MSRAAKLTLVGAIGFTAAIVSYVHTSQEKDRKRMRDGVVRDMQRQEMKKRQNLKALEDQAKLTRILKQQREEQMASQKAAEEATR